MMSNLKRKLGIEVKSGISAPLGKWNRKPVRKKIGRNREMTRKKRVLLIAPKAFYTGWMGGTKRLFHLAKAFRSLGLEVALFAGKMTNSVWQETIDRQFPGLVIRTSHTGSYPRVLDFTNISRRAWRALWKARGQDYYWARLSFGWAEKLNLQRDLKELLAKNFQPDLVWGVSGGSLAGGTAAARLSEYFSAPWIFELTDPPWGCGVGQERPSIKKEFNRLLAQSNAVVVNSEEYQKYLFDSCPIKKPDITTIHLTYEGEAKIEDRNSSTFWSLVYAGSLDGGRSIVPLLQAYHLALQKQGMLMQKHSRIDLFGSGSGFKKADLESKKYGLLDNVYIHGPAGKETVDEAIKNANALIIIIPNKTKYQVPGKLFECLKMCKPVIAIMSECETATILRRAGLGFIHAPEDIEGLANTLIDLWHDWRHGHTSVEPDLEYIRQFSAENLPEKLRPVLRKLL